MAGQAPWAALAKFGGVQDGMAYNANSKPVPLGSEEKREAIRRAETAGDMWAAIGEDSWAVVPIDSSLHPGQTLEGTRLTVVRHSLTSLRPVTATWHTPSCVPHAACMTGS